MIPSRGSKEAMAAGCYCPIGTWTSPHCPVHDADDTYQCPNCIRLEAELAFAHECQATAELCGDGFKAQHKQMYEAINAFLKFWDSNDVEGLIHRDDALQAMRESIRGIE